MGKHNLTAIIKDRKGRVLAVGRNSYEKTHPLQYKAGVATGRPNQTFLHAELAALLKISDWQKAYRIEIFRYTKDGKPALAAPCKACQFILKQTGVKEVIHT
jgi:deoxycytidylate deaminase